VNTETGSSNRNAQNTVIGSLGWLKFVRWPLKILVPQKGICCMSTFWGLEFSCGP